MTIKIQSTAFTLKKEVSDFIQTKVKKLTRFYREIIGIEVSLKIDKRDTKNNKVCRIRLIIPGNDMLAASQCNRFETATTQAVEAIKKQMERRKAKFITNPVKRNINDLSPVMIKVFQHPPL